MRSVFDHGRWERDGRLPARGQRRVGAALSAQLRGPDESAVRSVGVSRPGRRSGGVRAPVVRWLHLSARLAQLLHAGRVPVAHEPHATGEQQQQQQRWLPSLASVSSGFVQAAQAQVRDGMSARVRVLQEQRRDCRVLQVALPQGPCRPSQMPDTATVR